MATFFQKNGFDVQISIGTYLIDTTNQGQDNGLCDELTVNMSANQSRTALFSFIPPETTVTLEQFQGKEVHILIRTAASGWVQVFFGYVDTPSLNFIARKITLDCSDQRQNRVIQLPPGIVSTIGRYSEHVFGRSKDDAEELEKRLQTVAGDFDFDSYGNYDLTSWTPKVTPDIVITADEVRYIDNPSVQYTNRVKTINTINMTVNYSYQRLHQQSIAVVWPGFDDFLLDWWNVGKPGFPAKDTIRSAASSGDWRVMGEINLTDLWAAQAFDIGTGGVVIWQPNQVQYEYKGRTTFDGYLKDSTGNFVTVGDPARLVPQYKPVLDENGKQIMDVARYTVTDTSSHLCRGASWAAARRFSQTVIEKYSITLKSPQSIEKYGVIDGSEIVDVNDPYNTNDWENSKAISNTNDNFYINKKNNYSDLFTALQVTLNKARRDILNLHRDVTVKFSTTPTPRPEIDLKHTLEVTIDQSAIGSTASIHAKGKVNAISHYINFNTLEGYTEVTLRLSRALGSATSDVWSIPLPTENPSYVGTPQNIGLLTHIGENPDPDVTPGADKWTGWICNAYVATATSVNRTEYPESFIVDYPPIPDILRNEITYNSNTDFDLEIPNDLLEISF